MLNSYFIFNRLAKLSRNFSRAGERDENFKTCAMRTLHFISVDVDLSAKLYARDLWEEGATVSMLLRINAMGAFTIIFGCTLRCFYRNLFSQPLILKIIWFYQLG